MLIFIHIPLRLGPMDDPLLKTLSPCDKRSLSLTGSLGSEMVKSFHRHAYRIELHLHPFFSVSQFDQFQSLQATMGLLMSGKVVLSFFNRTPCNDTVLELYVHHGDEPPGSVCSEFADFAC